METRTAGEVEHAHSISVHYPIDSIPINQFHSRNHEMNHPTPPLTCSLVSHLVCCLAYHPENFLMLHCLAGESS